MKKLGLLLLTILVIFSLAACQKPGEKPQELGASESSLSESAAEKSLPDPATPEGAAAELFRGAKEWDVPAIDACLPEGNSVTGKVPPALEGTISTILRRMEYKVGRSTVDGDTAAVEMEITAVDAEGAVNEAIGKAVGAIVKQQLTGGAGNDYTAVLEEVLTSIDVGELPLKTTSATAHMMMGGDGEWKLDLSDEKNLPLLNAATGGAVDIAMQLEGLAETYGIPLEGLSP